MDGKKRAGSIAVTESEAQAALRRSPSTELTSEEEKVLRMRLGASLPLATRLERIAVASDADIELMS